MMNNDLYIKWETGHMNIHLDFFFPCSKTRFKKLLKIIALDWQHETELKEYLKVYFQKRIADLTELWKENSKKYYENKQKDADTEGLIESRKHPNGLPVSKKELKQAKADLRRYRDNWQKALASAKKNKKFKEQFEGYLKLL